MGQFTNQQQVVPGVRIDVSNLKGTTRFNDLQEDLQAMITKFDNFIQAQMEQKIQLDAFMPSHGEQLEAVPGDVRFVSRKADGVASALASDARAVQGLRALVKTDAASAQLSFRAVENLKLPIQYRTSGLWTTAQPAGGDQAGAGGTGSGDGGDSSSDLISFFSQTGDEMEAQLKRLEKNLGEIELHMHGVQANLLEQRNAASGRNGLQGSPEEKVAELAAVLKDFEEGILKVAGVVGGAREGMTELQLKPLMGGGRNAAR